MLTEKSSAQDRACWIQLHLIAPYGAFDIYTTNDSCRFAHTNTHAQAPKDVFNRNHRRCNLDSAQAGRFDPARTCPGDRNLRSLSWPLGTRSSSARRRRMAPDCIIFGASAMNLMSPESLSSLDLSRRWQIKQASDAEAPVGICRQSFRQSSPGVAVGSSPLLLPARVGR